MATSTQLSLFAVEKLLVRHSFDSCCLQRPWSCCAADGRPSTTPTSPC
ncbi:hypothetical protein ACIRJS_14305 [Streptomyces sp. NPDC102340]